MIFLCSGARETDYPAGEEVFLKSDLGLREDNGLSAANSSSDGGDNVLGSITVVGCAAEGAAAVPHTADSPGREHEKAARISSSASPYSFSFVHHQKLPNLFTDSHRRTESSRRSHRSNGDECRTC